MVEADLRESGLFWKYLDLTKNPCRSEKVPAFL